MFRRLLREYFSLTRGERQGLQVLCLLVILLMLFRGIMPRIIQPEEQDLTDVNEEYIAFLDSIQALEERRPDRALSADRWWPEKNSQTSEPFPFDPNTAGMDDLTSLGIAPGTARILVNYRNAGGKFLRDSDLLRVYGMTKYVFERLQPYINLPGDDSSAATITGFSGEFKTFELNRADTNQLISVYGIGPVFANRIIRYRDLLGGFHSPAQLMEVYGFSPAQYEELTRCSYIDTAMIRKLVLNQIDAAGLEEHPYLDRYQARAMISYRDHKGTIKSTQELIENLLLPDSVYRRIRPYLITGL